jgi:hypothetical protein
MAAIGISSGTVIVLITLVVLPVAAVSFARAGHAWRGIGGGRFSIEQAPPPPRPGTGDEVDRALQEAEARQMLEAKAYRRRRRGEEELRAEIRTLVIARNERRARRGEEPLDIEAETDRQLADLIGLEGR